MKKIIALLLTLVTVIGVLASCSLFNPDDTPDVDNTVVRIGVLNGPTGMGMAKLIADNNAAENKAYEIKSYASPDMAIPYLAKGELDMLCLPTNVAAKQAKKLDVSVAAINCLGSLYLMTDDSTEVKTLSDLDGQTVYTSVATSTTKPILEHLFEAAKVDVKIEVVADHDALVAKVVSNQVTYAVLPEPKASAALAKNNKFAIDLNISEEWDKLFDEPLTMGCIVVKNSFLAEHKSVVDSFLNDYKASIEYINDENNLEAAAKMIFDAGIIPAEPMAKKALKNLYGSIVYIDATSMQNALEAFYTAIGDALPSDDFYYASEN